MKILIIGNEHIRQGDRYMDDKGWSFRKSFDRLGVSTEAFFYKKKGGLAFLEKNRTVRGLWRKHMNRSLVDLVKKSKPDILMINKGETITAETLREIRRKTATVILNVFPDNPLYMGRFEAIEPCHVFFVKDTYVRDALWRVGLKNVQYLPQCTDPDVHRPVELSDEQERAYRTDLSLIGSMYPYRLKFVEELIGFRPAIWGRGWSRAQNPEVAGCYRGTDIRGNRKAAAICGSAISLNPHHPINDINGVNRRTYDIAACGGFQLSDHKPDLEAIFRVGSEIVCYRSMDELKEQIPYYLSHPDERRAIADAGLKRVLRDHTYDARAREILSIVAGLAR
ncbi:MAG: hypothetical protein OHK006_24200 [Thermodesulfovibrionales bacterium]